MQRACYLSLNPQKDETLETEKAQYVLPDGSTLNVRSKEGLDTSSVFSCCSPGTNSDIFFPFSDRSSQIPGSGAAVQTWPDRRRKLGHPRGSSLRHPEVWHGPSPHTLLNHCIMWGIDPYQRSVAVHLFKGFFPSSLGILSLVWICSIHPLSFRFWGKTTNRSQEAGTQRREDQGRLSQEIWTSIVHSADV